MPAVHSQCLELDLHRLELRYAGARLVEPRAVERLARSMERHGQVMACIGLAEGERVVLLDGYRRVAAFQRLGRYTALVECWSCDFAHALVTVLCRTQARANAEHAERLLQSARAEALSTRELHCCFEHYRRAGHLARERLIAQPRLFLLECSCSAYSTYCRIAM